MKNHTAKWVILSLLRNMNAFEKSITRCWWPIAGFELYFHPLRMEERTARNEIINIPRCILATKHAAAATANTYDDALTFSYSISDNNNKIIKISWLHTRAATLVRSQLTNTFAIFASFVNHKMHEYSEIYFHSISLPLFPICITNSTMLLFGPRLVPAHTIDHHTTLRRSTFNCVDVADFSCR